MDNQTSADNIIKELSGTTIEGNRIVIQVKLLLLFDHSFIINIMIELYAQPVTFLTSYKFTV